MANPPKKPLKCLLFSSFYVTFKKYFQSECLQSHLSDKSMISMLCLEGHPGEEEGTESREETCPGEG